MMRVQKMESALAYRLRTASDSEKLRIASEALADCRGAFHPELVDIILDGLGTDAAELHLGDSPNSAYLTARVSADKSDMATAAEDWEKLFQISQERDPFHLLAHARALSDLGRVKDAMSQIRLALEQPVKYAFFPRAERLIRKLANQADSHLRECRIALLSTSTTSLLSPIVQALCLRDRIKVGVYEGLYGSSTQEILDPSSGLTKFRPSVVFLMANWRDLQPGFVDGQKLLWKHLSDRFACHVVQHAFAFPPEEDHGNVEQVNRALLESAPTYVSVLDTPALQRETGQARWDDPGQWYSYRQHPSTEALPALGEAMLAHVRAILGLTRKVLVTDLDNTLWKGVIGEDGLDGIKIGAGSPAGDAHSRLQQYMLDLKARGILLAVASKNNHEDACLPFQKHPNMLLRLEDFAAFEANWNDKAASLREIARKLSLGLDSFVFLDDNPIEREWVRSQLPEVAVVELGDSVFGYVGQLTCHRYFFALAISAADRARAGQYQEEAARKSLQAMSQSLDEFLAQLQLRAACMSVDEGNVQRVTQLTNKTNQFNLTTRRYTEAQVRQLSEDSSTWAAAFQLSDRMGDYGLIGVIFCRPGEPATWEIDSWLMSCRVLGRQMEKFMFDRLMEAARERGISEVVGVYVPTQKNGLVRSHYHELGFTQEGEFRYRIVVPAIELRTATHIKNESTAVTEMVLS